MEGNTREKWLVNGGLRQETIWFCHWDLKKCSLKEAVTGYCSSINGTHTPVSGCSPICLFIHSYRFIGPQKQLVLIVSFDTQMAKHLALLQYN